MLEFLQPLWEIKIKGGGGGRKKYVEGRECTRVGQSERIEERVGY